MKQTPKIGSTYQRTFIVESRHLIGIADEEMPAVLSTPQLIAELEQTARESIAPLLDARERTVGVEVDIRHLAATPIGFPVTCTARVLQVEGTLITFQIEAADSAELVARGVHRRRVVEAARLKRRIERKQSSRHS